MQYTVIKGGQTTTFESELDGPSALAIVAGINTVFAQDLFRNAERLSANQWAWVHKLAVDARSAPKSTVAERFTALTLLFARTSDKLKWPAITFRVGEEVIRISRAGLKSRYCGDLIITDGRPYPANRFYGRIDQVARFHGGRDITKSVVDQIRALNADPAKAAASYGLRSGSCCMCDRHLTDDRSLAVGYGRTCAQNWSLPFPAKQLIPVAA